MIAVVILSIVGVLLLVLLGVWIFGERGHLLLPSTRAWIREGGGLRYVFSFDFWHGYVYGRWANQYIGLGIRRTIPNADPADPDPRWAREYHGKVLPLETAKRLITIQKDIPYQTLEQVIPFETARDIVLSAEPEIALYDCPCRAAHENPCQPTRVCMLVGQPFVDFIVEHNPHSAERISTAQAVELLEAEHRRGHVHVAYFKSVMHNRFYAICNCCSCCCGGIASMRHGVPMVIASGYVAQVDESYCASCGSCEDVCPFGAIQVNGRAEVDWEKCMGCGVCEGQCPNDAITMARDERKGVPLEVEKLTGD